MTNKIFLLIIIIMPLHSTDIQLAIDEVQPPFSFINNETDQIDGILTQIVTNIFEEIAVDFQISPFPWKRVLMMGESGTMGIIGIYKNSERLLVYDYTEPIFEEKIFVYSLTSDSKNYGEISELNGRSIGIISAWSFGDEFDNAKRNGDFRVETNNSDELNFKKLSMGRIDCLLAVEHSGDDILNELNLGDQISKQPLPLISHSVYMVFNKKSNKLELISKINNYLIEIKKDGTYDLLINKIFKDVYTTLNQ